MDVINEELNFRELIEEIRSNHKFMEGANEIKPSGNKQKATFNSDKKKDKCHFEQFNFKCHIKMFRKRNHL
jgi:phosphatidate phosphatase PAH1